MYGKDPLTKMLMTVSLLHKLHILNDSEAKDLLSQIEHKKTKKSRY